ncbi:tetratricopeptide repeat protein [Rhodopseudomonas thermotolerans]|uniref:Tetratricopeptide repeat protein n=2 Tax=Rhodopseudomonas TaxID=1073 RepID=A0A336JLF9_9BRAD|nr:MULTISPECIES: caspase family protein [Rhodopseudomonas]RED38833.1 tetratricopeptide repeat protein [Rhodopseudomonas pentothenatexigens]REG06904.1 tetratricopeptide repeat protein [Rhodopseudomonas thermotolerans]SSW89653.1 tetratricopeptide repeat protein [Rhodopseudomonas pentothenatexigens]
MNIRLGLVVVLLAALFATPYSFAADGPARVALVIGNGKYPDADKPLKQPTNDARLLAEELKRAGFDVDLGEDLSGDAMRRAFDRLYQRVKPGSVALVFFSGFGIQSGRQSYLVPVDAQIWTEPDVRRDGIALETVLGELNSRGASVKIALIDASRRNPFERRFRSFSAGLAPIIAPGGSLVMYAAALSSVVTDRGDEHSLFASELLKEVRAPGISAEEALNRTRLGVTRASRGEQVPWISSSLAEEFSFVPGAKAADKPVEAKPAAAAVAAPQAAPEPEKPAEQPKPAPKASAAPAQTAADQRPTPAPGERRDDDKLVLALASDPTVKSLNARIAERPSDGNSYYRRGQVYASKGAYRSAIKDFDEAIRLNPKDVEAYNNRCWVRTVIGELEPALADCNQALQLRPNFVDALDSRGLLHLKGGRDKAAIADFDAALKVNPRLTSSLYGRGLARKRTGLTSEGDIDLTTAKNLDPNIGKEFAGYGVR